MYMPGFLNTFLIANLRTCDISGVTGVTGETAMGSKFGWTKRTKTAFKRTDYLHEHSNT